MQQDLHLPSFFMTLLSVCLFVFGSWVRGFLSFKALDVWATSFCAFDLDLYCTGDVFV